MLIFLPTSTERISDFFYIDVIDDITQIYERGSQYAPSCVDLWANYFTYILEALGRAASNPAIVLSPRFPADARHLHAFIDIDDKLHTVLNMLRPPFDSD